MQPFGRTGDWDRLSDGRGRSPRWRADGREVFFLDLEGRLIAVPFDRTLGQRAGEPRAISGIAGPIEEFDVTPDGQRFVVTLPPTRDVPPSISVLLNWHRLLE